MILKDVTKNLRHQTDYRIEQRFQELLRTNPNYRNLGDENRELILDLIKKYQTKARRGLKTSDYTIRHDMYDLYQHRFKLGLTEYDLDQIRDLLHDFKE